MNRRKVIIWGIVILLLVALLSSVFLRSFSSNETAVDTSGTSAATPVGQTPTEPPYTPVTVNPPAGGNNAPFILFTPGVVTQGGAISVLGSEFDHKAYVDFLIKQKAADPGKVIGSTITDGTGSFSNIAVKVP